MYIFNSDLNTVEFSQMSYLVMSFLLCFFSRHVSKVGNLRNSVDNFLKCNSMLDGIFEKELNVSKFAIEDFQTSKLE